LIPSNRWLFGLAGSLAALGVLAFIWILVAGLKTIGSSIQQFIMPGKADISLTQPGIYTIFYESTSVVGDRVFSTGEDPPSMNCTVTSPAAGEEVGLTRPSGSQTYTWGRRSGRSVLEFNVENPGTFQFTCKYADGSTRPDTVFAVGHDFTKGLFNAVGLSLLSLFGGIGLGGLIVILAVLRRPKTPVGPIPDAPSPPPDAFRKI
jgi:hypothetical protein